VLERCLAALLSQTLPRERFEIIVSDDASEDCTEELVKQLAEIHGQIKYVRNRTNAGRSRTRNRGIGQARGEIVLLLDDDNVPDPDCVDAHLQLHRRAGVPIAVMGNVSFAPGIVVRSNFARFMQRRYLGHRGWWSRRGLDYHDLPGHYLGSLNCSIRREQLREVGCFDERFRHYGGEDENLGYALRGIGVRIVFGHNARTTHYDDVSIERYRVKYIETGREGLRLLASNNPDYRRSSWVGYLLPHDDSGAARFRQRVGSAFRRILSVPVARLLERWARATNGMRVLYCAPVYRLLLAAWMAEGMRSQVRGVGHVQYGEPSCRVYVPVDDR
jgi:GT2 family glycosyltransferase